MARKPPDLFILGEGAVATALKVILNVPVVPRSFDDAGWDWPKSGIADRCRLILVASTDTGADRIVRWYSEVWTAPGSSRIGVVIVVPDRSVSDNLLSRDVFGRKQACGSSFGDYADVVGVTNHPLTLTGIIESVCRVELLPVETWKSQQMESSCIPLLLEAIRHQSVPDLCRAIPFAKNVFWDSICRPTSAFPNHHTYAHAICRWLDTVTAGVTPDWKTGIELIQPLLHR